MTLDEYRYLPNADQFLDVYRIKDGDLLFTRYNGSIDLLGVCGIVRGLDDRVMLYPDKLMRVRFDHNDVIPEFVELYFASPGARARVTQKAKTTSGQQGVSGADIKAQPLVLVPLDEQREIVNRVRELLAAAEATGAELAESESALTQLDQSILAKAFRGELVPQDPRDEPASELLARIRRAREATTTGKPRGRSKRAAERSSQTAVKPSSDEPDGATTACSVRSIGKDDKVKIHVLTIKQPWADHIIFGNKWCENRNWTTQYRGPLYIHAGMSWDADGGDHTPGNGQHGAILGRVNLVDILDLEQLSDQEFRRIARTHGLSTSRAAMRHVFGSQCWILTEPQALKQPIETPGKLKITVQILRLPHRINVPQHLSNDGTKIDAVLNKLGVLGRLSGGVVGMNDLLGHVWSPVIGDVCLARYGATAWVPS